jgi:glycosyltransferase involved in cell wall biosynthesis
VVLSERSAALGATLGRSWEALEGRLLRQSDGIVAITDDFRADLADRGVDKPVEVIHNWAPLDEVRVSAKRSTWSVEHGLADRPVALYAGTLGLKHDPDHLVEAARATAASGTLVLVVTEGMGRTYLEEQRAVHGLDNLWLWDYVPYDELEALLGAADVCLVLLEADAGRYSAPSKVLTYLAAGRPVVAAIPTGNLAATTIERAQAGVVVRPGDYAAFTAALRQVLADDPAVLGGNARRYAEATFDITSVADRFERVLADADGAPAGQETSLTSRRERQLDV